jgi:hypothetical protein
MLNNYKTKIWCEYVMLRRLINPIFLETPRKLKMHLSWINSKLGQAILGSYGLTVDKVPARQATSLVLAPPLCPISGKCEHMEMWENNAFQPYLEKKHWLNLTLQLKQFLCSQDRSSRASGSKPHQQCLVDNVKGNVISKKGFSRGLYKAATYQTKTQKPLRCIDRKKKVLCTSP